jgi:hypothetical protein
MSKILITTVPELLQVPIWKGVYQSPGTRVIKLEPAQASPADTGGNGQEEPGQGQVKERFWILAFLDSCPIAQDVLNRPEVS